MRAEIKYVSHLREYNGTFTYTHRAYVITDLFKDILIDQVIDKLRFVFLSRFVFDISVDYFVSCMRVDSCVAVILADNELRYTRGCQRGHCYRRRSVRVSCVPVACVEEECVTLIQRLA